MAGLGRRSHYRKHLTDSVLNDFPEPNSSEGERLARVVGTRGSNQFEIILSLPSSSSSLSTLNYRYGSDSKRVPKLAILPTKFRKLVWVKRNDFVIVRCGDDEEPQLNVYGDGNSDGGGDSYVNDNNNDNNNNITGKATTKRVSKCGGRKEEEEVKYCNDSSSSLPRGTANDLAASAGPGAGPDEPISGIRYEISHILYKDQVKHLRRKGLWPMNDPYFQEDGVGVSDSSGGNDLVECVDREDDNSPRHAITTKKLVGKESEDAECLVDGYGNNDNNDDEDGIVYDDDLLFVNTNKISTLRILDSESDSESDSR